MIKKAIFPVAGLGTRFLPATKATPKEMLPIIDKPLMQYAVEEALEAGITELIFVTSHHKRAIEDHFDRNLELEQHLIARQQHDVLQDLQNIIPSHVTCVYIRQQAPLGLGHAVLTAAPLIQDQPFAVILPDDLIDSGAHPGCLQQMISYFQKNAQSLVAVEPIDIKDSWHYGMVATHPSFEKTGPIQTLVEKPAPHQAPSNLGVVGRYVFTPTIFSYLNKQMQQSTFQQNAFQSEIQLTDAIRDLLASESVHAFQFSGQRFDCGNKLQYLKAVIHYGLKRPEFGSDLKVHLSKLISPLFQ